MPTQAETGSNVGCNSIGYAANGNWSYTYDSLNRLTGASSAAGLNLAWSYDSFGNRKTQTASGSGSAPQISLSFTGNTNRVGSSDGVSYDAASHMTLDNRGQSYNYDAEGRVTAAFWGKTLLAVYEYNSEGDLVYENGSNGQRVFQRDLNGQPVWSYTPSGGTGLPAETEVYADDWIGAWEDGSFFFVGKDWLGTKRYELPGQGGSPSEATPRTDYSSSYTSLPFGDNLSSIGLDSTHFTGKERDTESGLDYFGARYYSSSMGRFMSPDPSGLYFAAPENPQTLNLYSYVGNNPLYYTDPSGLYACSPAPAGANVIGKIGHFFHNLFCNPNDGGSHSGGGQQPSGGGSPSQAIPTFLVTSRVLPPTEFGYSNGTFMNENIREASLFRYTPPGMATAYIYFAFRTGGREDYKNKMWIASDEVNGKITLTPDSYMDFGNLNYGESARAAGLPDFFVQRAPGFAHQYDITHSYIQAFRNSFLSGTPFGDQKRDQHYVSGDRSAYQDPDQ